MLSKINTKITKHGPPADFNKQTIWKWDYQGKAPPVGSDYEYLINETKRPARTAPYKNFMDEYGDPKIGEPEDNSESENKSRHCLHGLRNTGYLNNPNQSHN